ncbi:MAG: YebC/PmpR family DNA-binding transcriptional regulator [Erysipelotrichaceae bacterium]|nr:YebC/PmpR family DNA-binding transcriptional regulator [Erysipelotrichaceae bacterium]
MGRAHEVRKAAMEKTAAAKAKLYSRYGKEIYLIAKNGGPDTDANLALRRIVERAKKAQVPADVIKRAIDKVKSGATENYETLRYEGYGPGGSTVIVECMTDNVNRTLSQVRPAFTKSKAKLGASGSVSYQYDTISILTFKGLDEEQTLEALINGEVEIKDIETLEDGSIEITGEPTDLYKIKTAIEQACPTAEFDVEEITTIPQEYVTLEGEDLELFNRLLRLLNECDDVDTIYHNVENVEEV